MADMPTRAEIALLVIFLALLGNMRPKRRARVLARVVALYERYTLPENVRRLHDGDAEALARETAAARAWFTALLPVFVSTE